MYINPFLAGALSAILAEVAACVVAVIIWAVKTNKGGGTK